MTVQRLSKEEKLLFGELFKILEEHDSYNNDYGDKANEDARKALIISYHKLSQFKPSKKYSTDFMFRRGNGHLNYILYLLKIKKALQEEKYMRAVHELTSLIHYLPFLQGRIFYNILETLEEGLLEEGL